MPIRSTQGKARLRAPDMRHLVLHHGWLEDDAESGAREADLIARLIVHDLA
jgi:hypothetical protein